jgi:hypothetical protein
MVRSTPNNASHLPARCIALLCPPLAVSPDEPQNLTMTSMTPPRLDIVKERGSGDGDGLERSRREREREREDGSWEQDTKTPTNTESMVGLTTCLHAQRMEGDDGLGDSTHAHISHIRKRMSNSTEHSEGELACENEECAAALKGVSVQFESMNSPNKHPR